MKKEMPIKQISFNGETIKDVLYLSHGGRDLMFMAMESGKLVMLPVYENCPVLLSDTQTLKDDQTFIAALEKQKEEAVKLIDDTILRIKEL